MKRILLSLAAALCMSASAAAQTVAPFKDGDRAVFLGNSITDGGHYHSYIWLYYMTRFPYMDLRVMNAGIGGETAGDMYKRLDGDVLSKRPTVLTVTFGMNDTGYMEYNGDDAGAFGEKKYRECYDNFKKMEKRLQTLDGVRVVMLGGSPYDETAQIENNAPLRGKNAVMDRVVGFQKESAAANGWEFVDFSAPMVEIGRRVQAGQPSFSLSMGDRIHPDNDGHMVMAYLYLKAQGFAGREVADVQIDAAKAKVLKAGNCEITGLRRNGREISFDYLAEALPYPLDTLTHGMGSKRSQAEATKLVPFIEEMNREMLTVKGLKGDYTLYIDGERIGTWSGKQLGEGINLAELQTPQYRQAMEVMHLNEYRWEIERNFRDYAWVQYDFFQNKGLLDANDAHAVSVLDAEKGKNIWLQIHRENYAKLMLPHVREARAQQMELLVETIYEINKPQTQGRTAPELIRAGCKSEGRRMRPPFVLSGCSRWRRASAPRPRAGRDLLLVLPQRSLVGPAQREQLLRLFGEPVDQVLRFGAVDLQVGQVQPFECLVPVVGQHVDRIADQLPVAPAHGPLLTGIEVQHVVRRSFGSVADQRHDARPVHVDPRGIQPAQVEQRREPVDIHRHLLPDFPCRKVPRPATGRRHPA